METRERQITCRCTGTHILVDLDAPDGSETLDLTIAEASALVLQLRTNLLRFVESISNGATPLETIDVCDVSLRPFETLVLLDRLVQFVIMYELSGGRRTYQPVGVDWRQEGF